MPHLLLVDDDEDLVGSREGLGVRGGGNRYRAEGEEQ